MPDPVDPTHSEGLEHLWPNQTFTPIERALLGYLLRANERVVPSAELLREVWGYHPRTKTRTVQSTVQRLRVKIEVDPARPQQLLNLRGRGYQLVIAQRELPEDANLTREVLELRLASWLGDDAHRFGIVERPRKRGNLPTESTSFVGRSADIEALCAALADGQRLITLHGTAGLGKTRLAKRIAATVDYPGGAWFCDLSQATRADEAIALIRSALGLTEPVATSGIDALGATVANMGLTLLVLDNFEQLDDESARLLERLVLHASELRVLVTSRARLRIPCEVIYEVHPLELGDSTQLLRDRISVARIDRSTPIQSEATRSIAALLEGVPLALEMAAARARILPLHELQSRLESSFAVLRLDRRGAPDRQQTLHAAIDWSWQLLSDDEQSALAQLCAFRSGSPLSAAEQVLETEDDALAVLASLHDKSMLRTWTQGGRVRVGLFASIREFVLGQARPEVEAARLRHANWALEYGGHWRALYDSDPTAGGNLFTEMDNLVRAHETLLAAESELAIENLLSIWPIFHGRGQPTHFLEMLRTTAAVLEPTGVPAANLHLAIARTQQFHRELPEALRHVELGLAQVDESDEVNAMLQSCASWLYLELGQAERCYDVASKAIAQSERYGFSGALPALMNNAAAAQQQLRNWEQSAALYRRAIERAEHAKLPRRTLTFWCNLGAVLSAAGDLETANDCLLRARELALMFNSPTLLHTIRGNLAGNAARLGNFAEAHRLYGEVLEMEHRLGGRTLAGGTRVNAGITAILAGDLPAACAVLTEARAQLDRLGTIGPSPIFCDAYLVVACSGLDAIGQAETSAARVRAADLGKLGDANRVELEFCLGHLDLARARHEPAEAARHIARARGRLALRSDGHSVDTRLAADLLEAALRATEAAAG